MKRTVRGGGFINTVIRKIPFELHLPGYNYCGPNTKLKERLARGDIGINKLDEACKLHDIAYSNLRNLQEEHEADAVLASAAEARLNAKDTTWGERAAAWIVTKAMKTKIKVGGSLRPKGGKKRVKKSLARKRPSPSKKQRKPKCSVCSKKAKPKKVTNNKISHVQSFKNGLSAAKMAVKQAVKKGNGDVKSITKIGLKAAKKYISRSTGRNYTPRVLPVPQRGGFLPLVLPIFAALSALGSLAGGAAGVAAAVNKAKEAKKMYDESKRHNETMEALAIKGSGMFLKPYKTGLGLYLNPTNAKNL